MKGNPFNLEPVSAPQPEVPGHLIISASEGETVDMLLMDLLAVVDEVVGRSDRCDVLVSSTRSLQPVWQAMMLDPDMRSFPWQHVHLWMTDVCSDDWIEESLIRPSGICETQVHQATPSDSCDVSIVAVEPGGALSSSASWWSRPHDGGGGTFIFQPASVSIASLELAIAEVPSQADHLRWYLATHA